ncbi:MAG: hypothetical protein AABY22_03585 [Nanoarchaeota archaeon]
MNTYKTKTRIGLTIDEKIWELFTEIAKKHSINKSLFFENKIKEWLRENN